SVGDLTPIDDRSSFFSSMSIPSILTLWHLCPTLFPYTTLFRSSKVFLDLNRYLFQSHRLQHKLVLFYLPFQFPPSPHPALLSHCSSIEKNLFALRPSVSQQQFQKTLRVDKLVERLPETR